MQRLNDAVQDFVYIFVISVRMTHVITILFATVILTLHVIVPVALCVTNPCMVGFWCGSEDPVCIAGTH
jgi:hypothetical protein